MQQLVFDEPCDLCGRLGPHPVLIPNVQGKPYNLVECPDCGLRFFNPRPDLEARLAGFLSAGPGPLQFFAETGEWDHERASLVSKEQQWAHLRSYASRVFDRARIFCRMPSQAPRVYEIGSWVGWFLGECVMNLGADPRSSGCDANPFSKEIAEDYFGVSVEPLPFQLAAPPAAPYDIIIMNDVIEHTQTPSDDLHKARFISRTGACLWIKTFLDELDIPRGRPMMNPPDHAYHFTRSTLRRALTEADWNIVSWEENPQWSQVGIFALAG